jgi:hypothetical protein
VSAATRAPRLDWAEIVGQAVDIVRGYSTGVTLRQLFYRLVSTGALPNTNSAYKTLSARTAEARREDGFPALIDNTREIVQAACSEDPHEALEGLVHNYRRDRTEGQQHAIYIGAEKNTLAGQLWRWFGDYGFPIIVLRGYSSQTYVDDVYSHVSGDGRDAVLIYAGDFDPSGEDIQRDFEDRTEYCFGEIVRVAVTPEQIGQYTLPPQPGKVTDTRAGGFLARHGQLVQVEVEALAPDDLRRLYQDAVDRFWDKSAYEAVLEQENDEQERLQDFLDDWNGGSS